LRKRVQINMEMCSGFTDKKKLGEIVLIQKEIRIGAAVKLYMSKGFLIYEEMRKYLVIYEEGVSYTVYDFAPGPLQIFEQGIKSEITFLSIPAKYVFRF
jgi:hypothetical protein